MLISAEMRWFWRAQPPGGLDAWFRAADVHGCVPGGGATRTDWYLSDRAQDELGIKARGGRKGVELKGLVLEPYGRVTTGPFAGTLQLWTKWSSAALLLPQRHTVATTKRRWLRKFATNRSVAEIALGRNEQPLDTRGLPTTGCNVEWTRVTLADGAVWWTLGFEAFGPLDTLEHSVCRTAKLLSARHPPPLRGGTPASYPAWLKQRAQ
jgi:hypothetical protein